MVGLRLERGKTMKYLNGFLAWYWKSFKSFYKIITIVVLGGIAIFAISQVSGLSVLVCVALGWFLHKNYQVKVKVKKPVKAKKV